MRQEVEAKIDSLIGAAMQYGRFGRYSGYGGPDYKGIMRKRKRELLEVIDRCANKPVFANKNEQD